MAVQLILKNSSVEDRRPSANQLANGEISLNYNEAGAFLCCRDTAGAIQQVGGVKISATAPEDPVRQTQWFEPASLTLFIYDGDNWLPIAGGGGGGGGGTGDISTIIGNNGIDASEIAGVVTLNVDLAGGQDGLEFKAGQLSASIATETSLGSVKIGEGIDVTADGTISVDTDKAGLQPDEIIGGDGIEVTPGADNVEIDVDLAPNKGLEFIGGQLAADIGDGLQFNPDGSIGIDGDVVLQTGDIIGGDGINVTDGTGTATVEVDLLGGQDGLEIKSNKLTATVATKTTLGSVKIGDEISVDADGTISGNPIVPPVISESNAPDFAEDYIWFDTDTAEAYVGYKDPSGDEYWVSLVKVGTPGKDGKDVIISQASAPPFQEDAIWFDTSTAEAYFGYLDPSGDEYWISLVKVGAPGKDGIDGIDGTATISATPPDSPGDGEFWIKDTTGQLYAWWNLQSVWVSA